MTRKSKNHHVVIEFEATGTHWWLTFFDPEDVRCAEAAIAIVREFEANYSRFQSSSFITQLNNKKRLTSPPDEFVQMLLTCAKYYDLSGGLFNISVGGLLEKYGYGKPLQTTESSVSAELQKDIVVSKELIVISDKVRIDLGGIGKGWLIDKLATYLQTKTSSGFIVNGGGDLYVCSLKPVRIEMEHPLDHTKSIGYVELKNQALAVSSPVKRKWKTSEGSTRHHIINPKIARSESKFLASFVVAPTACEADIVATILLVADESQRRKIYEKSSTEYLLIHDDLSQTHSQNSSATMY